MKNSKYIISSLLTLSTACVVLYSLFMAVVYGDYSPVDENALVENFQVFLLAITCLVFLCYVFRGDSKDRAIFAFFAFLFYSFIMREVDFEKFGLDERLVFMFHGVGRNTLAVVVFCAIFLWAGISDFWGYFDESVKIIFSKWGAFMICSLLFVAIGQIFEKTLNGGFANLCEEICEIIGYLGFCVCTIDPLGFMRGTTPVAKERK